MELVVKNIDTNDFNLVLSSITSALISSGFEGEFVKNENGEKTLLLKKVDSEKRKQNICL